MITVNSYSAYSFKQLHKNYITLPFFYDGKPVTESSFGKKVPSCIMSLASAGSLRYNSGKENLPRQKFLKEVLPDGTIPVPVYLIHSKRVYVAEPDANFSGGVCLVASGNGGQSCVSGDGSDSTVRVPVGSEGDGVITSCRSFAPVVTAADCMPVFLWDSGTGAFGICHSGWKGTGIASEAVSLMGKTFGSKPDDVCVVLGPHIHDCCYTVDAERASYFSREFSPDCCTPYATGKYRLSLARANIVSLTKAGIKPENILHCTDCTSCFSLPATFGADNATAAKAGFCDIADSATAHGTRSADTPYFPYGSFRRQTAHLPEGTPLEERFKVFSAMAAVIGYDCAQK